MTSDAPLNLRHALSATQVLNRAIAASHVGSSLTGMQRDEMAAEAFLWLFDNEYTVMRYSVVKHEAGKGGDA